jgi:hypothetical protein
MNDSFPPLVGYFHVCFKKHWKTSFDLVWKQLKQSGLYDRTQEIRIGIAQDETQHFTENGRFLDPKIKIVARGTTSQYERITLLKMRKDAEREAKDTLYWYAHTKGIRHFDTPREPYIRAWLQVLYDSNFQNWKVAVQVLKEKKADVYGCLYMHHSYLSGNFWWTTPEHVKNIPFQIQTHYSAPEEWILMSKNSVTIAETFSQYGDPYSILPPQKQHCVHFREHYSLRFMAKIALLVLFLFFTSLFSLVFYSKFQH